MINDKRTTEQNLVSFSINLETAKSSDCGSGSLVNAFLDSSEEIDCPSSSSSNDHNFRSFASIGLIFFVLIAAEFDGLSEKLSRRERFAHPVARCCVDCRRFLACFCL